MTLERLMKRAYECALHSPDPSSQNGAILVYEDGATIGGWNAVPKVIADIHVGVYNDRAKKYRYVTHAEESVLLHAAKWGMSTIGSTVVCPWAACTRCARQMIEAGVKRVVRHKQRMGERSDWDQDIIEADSYMRAAGIDVYTLDVKLDISPILVSGKLWYAR